MGKLQLPVAEPLLLRLDEEGVVRVGRTRVTLDAVVAAFNCGSTAEEILLDYSSLQLADIYDVIAYYLRHREEVDAYVEHRRLEAEEIRRKIEEVCPPDNFRERLLARRGQQP
jgi:uncharacterized protein (DUF433 family)